VDLDKRCRGLLSPSATLAAVAATTAETTGESQRENAVAGNTHSRRGGFGEFVRSLFLVRIRLETEISVSSVFFRAVKILQELVGLGIEIGSREEVKVANRNATMKSSISCH
jgi:hypothetical protein